MSLSVKERAYDRVIVGGGIIGLATAREFLRRNTGARVAILEKEAALASHQTGHNSGVIHTGVYYRPGSLKARLCVEGRDALIRFCDERGIPYVLSGKLIVALDQRERHALDEIGARGRANGVAGIQTLPREAIPEHEPHATGHAALWVPGAGIIDYSAVAEALANEIRALGGTISVGCEVRRIAREGSALRIGTRTGSVLGNRVIACAGLQCDRVASFSSRVDRIRIIPFRGDYYRLRAEARPLIRSMIYPVPDPRYPFLGVHFTRRFDGEVWAGPNAVLALAREAYTRSGFSWRDAADLLAWPGFWRVVGRHWRVGLSELRRDWSKQIYARDLARYVPSVRPEDLLPGPSGVRAQAVARDGTFVDDFALMAGSGTMHVLNAPSPAATSALAIAREIVDREERAGKDRGFEWI